MTTPPLSAADEVADKKTRQAYLATVVTVDLPERRVSAQQAAQALGPFHVLTAWNPGAERPDSEANANANQQLRAELDEIAVAVLPAIGSASDYSHAEESFAAWGLSNEQAVALGARYRQAAVFVIDAEQQTVLGASGGWSLSRSHC